MKTFSSEFAHNYGTYTFGYAHYAQREAGDALADIYARGFLPYSGAREVKDTFYMARSARVELAHFELTSENRRIAKKFDGDFTCERVSLKEFKADDAFYEFCLSYFSSKHGQSAMPRERLEFIMTSGLVSDVLVYCAQDRIAAYVLEVSDERMGHFWFSFYDLTLAAQSLGLWLMLDALRRAKERGLTYYYLGTVYGQKALYKTNFEPLEWWDGSIWQQDVKLLKERGRSDEERTVALTDAHKTTHTFF